MGGSFGKLFSIISAVVTLLLPCFSQEVREFLGFSNVNEVVIKGDESKPQPAPLPVGAKPSSSEPEYPPYPKVDDDEVAFSCFDDGLKSVRNTVAVEVNVNGQYSVTYTMLLIRMLERKMAKLSPGSRIAFTVAKEDHGKAGYLLKSNLLVTVKPMKDIVANSALNTGTQLTGNLSGTCNIFDRRKKATLMDCPVNNVKPGTNTNMLTQQLIEATFKNI